MKYSGFAIRHRHCLILALLAGSISTGTLADDIDVYKATINAQQKPNILFVLDYSGSMGWDTSGVDYSKNNGPLRISVLKSAMNQILDNNVDNINAGLGSLYSFSTTGIRWPISDLAADASSIDSDIQPNRYTVRDIIKQRINEKNANGATATVDALVEAAQYFRGDPVTHNDTPLKSIDRHEPARWDSVDQRYQGGDTDASIQASYSPSHAWSKDTSQTFFCDDYTGSGGPNFCEQKIVSSCKPVSATDAPTPGYELNSNLWGDYQRCEYNRTATWMTPHYNSPITDSCEAQTNAIVLITDGVPTAINKGASLRSLVGQDLSDCEDLSSTLFAGFPSTGDSGNCAIEIVQSLATEPVNAFFPDSHVKTYTVGFNINGAGQQYLERLATAGQGESYNAQTPDELSEALTEAILDIRSGSENFAELSVDVDKATFSHKDRVYYSLFSPSIRRAWQGNLKGYFVEPSGLVDIHGMSAANGNAFTDEAQSFWSAEPDGNRVKAGGASEQLLEGTRKLYTFVGKKIPSEGISLATRNDTRLEAANDDISNTMLGLGKKSENNAVREAALNWIQSAAMGDPLHTKSVGVNYEGKQVLYIMTNQGLLHAFNASKPGTKGTGDSSGGEELFAFMPKRLLANLPELRENTVSDEHVYGLDGSITRWHDDTNNDGIVNGVESVMLYFGMRRGGSAYYAMDVSDPDAPVLKWVIDENSDGFESLAQSWSRMSMIRVADGETFKRVLAFGAGYDASAQDDQDQAVKSKGNAIYMVDESGELVWSVGEKNNPNMDYSIASDLALIDSDGDQLADRLYVGDIAGQIWRIDFGDISQNAVVTRMANLGDTSHQPFFYPPSVALNGVPGDRFLSITIGSGNRTNPLLSSAINNFYMIRDTDIEKGGPTTPFSTVGVNNLFDASSNAIQSSDEKVAETARKALDEARGWRVKLAEGEKALSTVLTYEGKVMATTFKASTQSGEDECSFESTGMFYVMDVNDASVRSTSGEEEDQSYASIAGNQDNTAPKVIRGKPVDTQGIPSTPVPVFAKGSNVVQIFVDKEPVDEFSRTLSRVYWHAR